MATYYQVLGAAQDATMDTIKALFRLVAKRDHPDKGGSEEAFVQAREAFEATSPVLPTASDSTAQVLYDPESRAAYDRLLRSRRKRDPSSTSRRSEPPPPTQSSAPPQSEAASAYWSQGAQKAPYSAERQRMRDELREREETRDVPVIVVLTFLTGHYIWK